MQLDGQLQQGHASRRARAFTQAHAQFHQRLQSQRLQRQAVAGFFRAMAGQQPGGYCGVDGTGGQCGCAGDEAIHQGRHTLCGPFQIEAGHGGDFQPAQFGQYLCAAQLLSLQALQRLQGQQLSGTQVLAELGGLEIAAMAGFYLEGAAQGVPSLVDGFIASAAALAARAIDPAVAAWLLASHRSEETGHRLALEALGLEPLVELGMRLGEGSGAATCVPLLQLAIKLHAEMATFAQAGVTEKD